VRKSGRARLVSMEKAAKTAKTAHHPNLFRTPHASDALLRPVSTVLAVSNENSGSPLLASARRERKLLTTKATNNLKHFFLSSKSLSRSPISFAVKSFTFPSESRRDLSEVGAPTLSQIPRERERTSEVYSEFR